MPEYFDIHSHVNFKNFADDRDAVIARMKEEKIATITVGTTVEDSKEAIELAEKHDNFYACVGIHPTHEWTEADFVEIEKMAQHSRVVAIGECGLDFYRSPDDEETKFKQGQAFARHIEIALKYDKPLMIHCRNAYDEVLSILSAFKKDHAEGGKLRGNMHFFAGSLDVAKKLLSLGFTMSFDGPITFAREYDEVIRHIPADMIMSETDSPFAAPAPFRGKRNEPPYIKEIVKSIASIRGEDLETVKKTLVSNAQRHFRIPG